MQPAPPSGARPAAPQWGPSDAQQQPHKLRARSPSWMQVPSFVPLRMPLPLPESMPPRSFAVRPPPAQQPPGPQRARARSASPGRRQLPTAAPPPRKRIPSPDRLPASAPVGLQLSPLHLADRKRLATLIHNLAVVETQRRHLASQVDSAVRQRQEVETELGKARSESTQLTDRHQQLIHELNQTRDRLAHSEAQVLELKSMIVEQQQRMQSAAPPAPPPPQPGQTNSIATSPIPDMTSALHDDKLSAIQKKIASRTRRSPEQDPALQPSESDPPSGSSAQTPSEIEPQRMRGHLESRLFTILQQRTYERAQRLRQDNDDISGGSASLASLKSSSLPSQDHVASQVQRLLAKRATVPSAAIPQGPQRRPEAVRSTTDQARREPAESRGRKDMATSPLYQAASLPPHMQYHPHVAAQMPQAFARAPGFLASSFAPGTQHPAGAALLSGPSVGSAQASYAALSGGTCSCPTCMSSLSSILVGTSSGTPSILSSMPSSGSSAPVASLPVQQQVPVRGSPARSATGERIIEIAGSPFLRQAGLAQQARAASTEPTAPAPSQIPIPPSLAPRDASLLFANDTSMLKPLAQIVRELA
ncbi:hypothetical protein HK105_204347 [Polyrhizophydium stewartii]|uniref:Uncharacterized protein n=1 Tax=Polyrhizophydium stewartii TaxID=2732419 RepID=A0ABR4N9N9_9FUNG